ncbi:uncharacterized protein LOC117321580 [Pecten maximus]|uniref:uncharacterized protein LOC117321580 n=1 Tax=Pecten maximus TaxID=6579 RepID=UPI001458C1CE|nr:uncharacterized protein LOC117321580 [Pecten maximus]XP_033731933.1 uncharacterized protein LOC117321580 [Pecten maximus]
MLEDEDDDVIIEEVEGADGTPTRPLTLGDFITGVLNEKISIGELESRRENSFGIAMGLAARVVNTAYGIHPLYPKYISTRGGKPELENLRAIDVNKFQCFIPIKRPAKPDTFTMVYKTPSEYPNHRILLSVNESLFSVDKMQISKEWGHCVDTNGFLRPDFILHWFNDGLAAAVDFLREARPHKAKKHHTMDITHSAKKDGTFLVNFYTNQSIQPHLFFTLNIVPCIQIAEVPKQSRLQVPIASRRPYYEFHTDFKKQIKDTLTQGEKMFYLEATVMPWTNSCGYDGSIVCSWGLNIGCLEDRALHYICQMATGKFFRDVIMLIERIKDTHAVCLHTLTNRIIQNAIFYQHKKSMGVVKSRSRWFIKVMERISSHMKSGVFPAFFQSKYNLLCDFKPDVLSGTAAELDNMLESLNDIPENIYVYTGLESELEEIDETKPYRDDPPKVKTVEEQTHASRGEVEEDSLFDRTITTMMSETTDRSYDDTFCDESDDEPIFITGPVRYGYKRHEIRPESKMSGQTNSRSSSKMSGKVSASKGSTNSSSLSSKFGQSARSVDKVSVNGSIKSIDTTSRNGSIRSSDVVSGKLSNKPFSRLSRNSSLLSIATVSSASNVSVNGLNCSVGKASENISKGSVGKVSGPESLNTTSKSAGHVHSSTPSQSKTSLQSSTHSLNTVPRPAVTLPSLKGPGETKQDIVSRNLSPISKK